MCYQNLVHISNAGKVLDYMVQGVMKYMKNLVIFRLNGNGLGTLCQNWTQREGFEV